MLDIFYNCVSIFFFLIKNGFFGAMCGSLELFFWQNVRNDGLTDKVIVKNYWLAKFSWKSIDCFKVFVEFDWLTKFLWNRLFDRIFAIVDWLTKFSWKSIDWKYFHNYRLNDWKSIDWQFLCKNRLIDRIFL